jgi:hypothetical protein
MPALRGDMLWLTAPPSERQPALDNSGGWHTQDMAVVFELVVNFGQDELSVSAAKEELERHPPIEVRGTPLPLTPPFVTRFFAAGGGIRYVEFAVHPRGIGYGGPGPKAPFRTRDLTGDEIATIGRELYELLRRFRGYDVALVGWDPEALVDVHELEVDYVDDGSILDLNGLVLANRLVAQWNLDTALEAFDPEHQWLPYQGTSNAWG